MSIYVADIYTYPLKSGRYQQEAKAEVTPTGFSNDRKAMLVHADGPKAGTFISQRTPGCEKLGQVITSRFRMPDDAGSDINYSFMLPSDRRDQSDLGPVLHISKAFNTKSTDDVNVWGNECKGIDAGDEAAQFFSDYLKLPVRLMLYPEQEPRVADPNWARATDVTSYADGFPFLITSKPSLDLLKSKITTGEGIQMGRFRPNIILDGNLPFEEDIMHHIRIGDVELEVVKPCARCVMTTIDELSVRGKGEPLAEPLATLTNMRLGRTKELKGVFFGQNAVPRSPGTIHIGDKVEIISTRPMHPALQQAALRFEA